ELPPISPAPPVAVADADELSATVVLTIAVALPPSPPAPAEPPEPPAPPTPPAPPVTVNVLEVSLLLDPDASVSDND
ncbi:MAG TPA: hypothetical protein VHX39_05005, partial [Acetobacteraceae bacterium]|nr:hypothetical protein [Acetobacteraceae bacterium]